MSGQIHFDPPQPADLTAMLHGYEVHDLVATGGMGAVYRATHVSLDRMVAIKVLPAEFADASFHEQFQAEARAMAKLNHPNLIGIYDFGQANGLPFIVMEFVAGKSLYYSAYQKAIEESTAVRITIEICDGLAQAHANNIVHRDIKPANILMDPDAHAKIGDFGLASQGDGAQRASNDVIYGTPGYAAPEIIHNPSAIGKPSDIFAVGVILYELLTGHLPDAKNPKPASRIANTDPRLDRVIRKATHNNPAMRYQDAEEMAADLVKISTTAPPRPTGRQLSTPRKTGRLLKRTSGPVQVQAMKRSGPVQLNSPATRDSKPQRLSPDKKTAPILTKPKKITGKVAAKTSKDYKENKDLSTEKKVNERRRESREKSRKSKTAPQPKAFIPPEPKEATSLVPPIAAQVPSTTNWSFIRNCIIIAVLAPLLFVLWGKYKEKQQTFRDKEAKRLRIEKAQKDENNTFEDSAKRQADNKKPRRRRPIPSNIPDIPDEIVHIKTPLEQLRELKASLAGGARDSMPDSTIERGTTFLMHVPTKMTWSQACRFAEEHGAHLATPTTGADLSWFSANLPRGVRKIWIGGGAQGGTDWGWVTGAQWNHRKPSTDLGPCALFTAGAPIKGNPDGALHSFFLQWYKDGSNPGTLAAQMERLNATLKDPSPTWPPGTINFQARHYLFVSHSTTWDEADFVANSGNGHLAVCSDRVEAGFIDEILQISLKSGTTAWLGGIRRKGEWTWLTGEPFIFPQWRQGSPKDAPKKRGLRFFSDGNNSGWDNANPYDPREVSGYLIEWSKDKLNRRGEAAAAEANPKGKLTTLRRMGRSRLAKLIASHKKLLRDNRKTFEWDLNGWFNRLSKNNQQAYSARVNEYKADMARANDIPNNLNRVGMPSRVRDLYSSALERQKRFENGLNKKIFDLRNAYLGKLVDAQKQANAAGFAKDSQEIAKEIKAIGQDAQSFRKHFGQ